MMNQDNSNIEPELKDILDELAETMSPEDDEEIKVAGEVKPIGNSDPIKKEVVDNELTQMLDQLEEEAADEEEIVAVNAEIVAPKPQRVIEAQRELKQEIYVPDDEDERLNRLLSKALVIGENVLGNIEEDRKEVDRCLKMIFDKALDDNKAAIEQVSNLLNTKAQINSVSAKIMDSIIKLMQHSKKSVKAVQNNTYKLSKEEMNKLLDGGKS